jgi:sterol desaturase/sphingolipid hydroxylase (fatty acid hydroxylase superfamily)
MEWIHLIMDRRGVPILLGTFGLLLIAETVSALRTRAESRKRRIFVNVIFAIPGLLTLRLILLPAMVWTAWQNESWQIGLSHWIGLPYYVDQVLVFLVLDYLNYIWHTLNHHVPLLWRFHLVHHTDRDLDVTTAIRFHAGELLTSVIFRGLAVLITGASPEMVLIYEISFEAATQFHHSNWRLPRKLEFILNKLIVTPRMHGIHHSIVSKETDSNFSVIFSIWDRIHGTIKLNKKQREIVIGAPGFTASDSFSIVQLLKLPFNKIRK